MQANLNCLTPQIQYLTLNFTLLYNGIKKLIDIKNKNGPLRKRNKLECTSCRQSKVGQGVLIRKKLSMKEHSPLRGSTALMTPCTIRYSKIWLCKTSPWYLILTSKYVQISFYDKDHIHMTCVCAKLSIKALAYWS